MLNNNSNRQLCCQQIGYIIVLLSIFIVSSCKSECEKAAQFSATDYETASDAMDHKLIINLKCKEEIDKLGLDKKSAAKQYCDYTKDCVEINEILRNEEKEREEAEKRKAEEERQAKIAELKLQMDHDCPNRKYKLGLNLTNEQRHKCWESKKNMLILHRIRNMIIIIGHLLLLL